MSCSSDDQPYELELYAEGSNYDNDYNAGDNFSSDMSDDRSVGVKLTYKFGQRVPDCSILYEYAMERKRLELEEMKAKLKLLQGASKLDWASSME
ncbi:hypothetical protein [Endozoicomonas sp. ALB032]|uniref:hypothetical protein n=1 Tax=Endozoicomonas sp. ALB032 TaxID=3403082 RepID=UPI003BB76981